jgi:hypothetical protein
LLPWAVLAWVAAAEISPVMISHLRQHLLQLREWHLQRIRTPVPFDYNEMNNGCNFSWVY